MMKKTTSLSIILFLFNSIIFAGDIPDKIITGFTTGNSSLIAEYFGKSVELTLPDKEDVFSKTQAEMILRDFFSKNPPSKFTIIHKGGKENSQYAIGKLVSGNNAFRITILLKSDETQISIHQLRIENDNVE